MKARVEGVTFTLSEPAEDVVRLYRALVQDIIHLDFERHNLEEHMESLGKPLDWSPPRDSTSDEDGDEAWWTDMNDPTEAEYDVDQLRGLRSRRKSQELGGPDDGG
jgi:hypothetical protein